MGRPTTDDPCDVDRGQPDRPQQHHRRRQRLPARSSTRVGMSSETPALACARLLRRRQDVDRCTRSITNSRLPGQRRPGGGLRRFRPRLLRDPGLPLRRPDQRNQTRTSSCTQLSDGGKTWNTVACRPGQRRRRRSVGDLLDKEYVAAWGNGNAIVTYGDFRHAPEGQRPSAARSTRRSLTTAAHTWSTPAGTSAAACDEAFVSVPTVTADGRVFVVVHEHQRPRDRPRHVRGRRGRPGQGRPHRRPVRRRRW